MTHALRRTPLDEGSVCRRSLYLYNTQHSQKTYIYTNVGIRTRNPKKWAAADPRLRPRGDGDGLVYNAFIQNNIPSTLWLTAYLPSLRTLQLIQWHLSANVGITSLVSMFGLVSSGIIPIPPHSVTWQGRSPVIFWYFGFLETALSWLLEVVLLTPRWRLRLTF